MARGRPKKEITRSEQIRIRLTIDEYKALHRYAIMTNQYMSDIIRNSIKEYLVKEK